MNTFKLIIQREFLTRVSKRSYWSFTVFGVLLMIALVFLPTLMNWMQKKSTTTVVVSDPRHLIDASLRQNPDTMTGDVQWVFAKPGDVPAGNNDDILAYLKRMHAKVLIEVGGTDAAHATLNVFTGRLLDTSTV
ncbi:hypothetical protein GCM10025857_28630 [Alicyclobacillus contaminans]|uniref:hypothetical protein n=1 Tax=Alicyclobacillus contaminans TaxID=392016 RepID=UPI0004253D9D|nr:hypothetical protein [Alicyclobacillus contaminans]GMA51506.1 hypothetical protein GCM10025857_28630 [Alicyclobacillus contaminans]